MNNDMLQSFKNLIFLNNTEKIKFDLKMDNFNDLIINDLNKINSYYCNIFTIGFNNEFIISIKNFDSIEVLSNEEIFLLHLLKINKYDFKNIKINNYLLEKNFVKDISDFIDLLNGKEINFFLEYLDDQTEIISLISKIYYYGVGNDTFDNIKKSIFFLDILITKYPRVSTFYLFRIRQKFNLVYRVLIGKERFNKLVTNTEGLKIIYSNKYIKECIKDFSICEKNTPNYSIVNLYKGKFLLHLLNRKGIDLLFNVLKKDGNLFDFEIFAWLAVYYLQIGNYKKARFYIFNSLDNPGDPAKYIGKLFYYYIIAGNFTDFNKSISLNDIEIIFLNDSRFFRYNTILNTFVLDKNFKDKFDLGYRCGFYINDLPNILGRKYKNIEERNKIIFENISKDYYDHWNNFNDNKVIFYSYNNFDYFNIF